MNYNYKKNLNKKTYCTNCGRNGHNYNKCNEPITSLGIIAFKHVNIKHYQFLKKTSLNKKILNIQKFNTKNNNILTNLSNYKNDIQFLMIRRKKTLGYIEFMRGRYSINNEQHLISLFEQMTVEEMFDIQKKKFHELWEELWKYNKDNKDNKFYNSEFEFSHSKYNEIKQSKDINFSSLCSIQPKFGHAEWGFPKGRRKFLEKNLDCAVREFKEETRLKGSDFFLLDNVSPLIETFKGTNNILYKHIYYLAVCKNDIQVSLDEANSCQMEEIGDIKWCDYKDCINKIRPNHIDRRKILNEVYIFNCNMIEKNKSVLNLLQNNSSLRIQNIKDDDKEIIDSSDNYIRNDFVISLYK